MYDHTLLQFPYDFKDIEPSEQEELNKLYDAEKERNAMVGSVKNWDAVAAFCKAVITQKEEAERVRRRTELNYLLREIRLGRSPDALPSYISPFIPVPRNEGEPIAVYRTLISRFGANTERFPTVFYVYNEKCFRVGPKGYLVYEPYKKDAANIYNMPLRSTDVFVASYQRSGTTLTQELVWLLVNDFNYTKAAEVPLNQRYSFLDNFIYYDEKLINTYVKSIKERNFNTDEEKLKRIFKILCQPISGQLASMPSPRFIKTHLPLSLLNPKLLDTAKVLYVVRDPRDVIVSSYHHAMLFRLMKFPNGFKCFWDIFQRGLFTLLPYFEHVKEAWNKRHHPNMLFLFYEEMSKDLPAAIRRVANFLNQKLDREQLDRLLDHLSIENFRNNPSVNFEEFREFGLLNSNETFIREGKTGGWRDYFDEEMTQQVEQWIVNNLRDTDLRFPHMESYNNKM